MPSRVMTATERWFAGTVNDTIYVLDRQGIVRLLDVKLVTVAVPDEFAGVLRYEICANAFW